MVFIPAECGDGMNVHEAGSSPFKLPLSEEPKFADIPEGDFVLPQSGSDPRAGLGGRSKQDDGSSSAACIDLGDTVPRLERSHTCLLRGRCLDLSEMAILHSADDAIPEHAHVTLASDFERVDNLLRFRVVEAMPDAAVRLPGIWAVVHRYYAHNAGHVLGDEVWAAWRMMVFWDLQGSASEVNILADQKPDYLGYRDETWDRLAQWSERMLKQYEALTSKKVNIIPEVRQKHGDVVCFETLLVGNAYLGYSLGWEQRNVVHDREYPSFASTFQSFRRHALKHLKISTVAPWEEDTPKIVILEKKASQSTHRQLLSNVPELVSHAQTSFPEYEVISLSWDGVPMRTQVGIMSSTSVVMSIPGSAVMNVVWLPLESTAILISRNFRTRVDATLPSDLVVITPVSTEYIIWFSKSGHKIDLWESVREWGDAGYLKIVDGGFELALPPDMVVERIRRHLPQSSHPTCNGQSCGSGSAAPKVDP